MKRILFIALLMFFSSLLVGCSLISRRESPLGTPTVSQFGSPLSPTSPSSPPSSSIDGPAFEVEEPVLAGASQVRGKGPYNTPIVIVDVTLAAKPLGSGVIASDGTFTIDVSKELILNHRIGIMAGMAEGMTPVPSIEAYIENLKKFQGDGYKNLPYIGVIFASSMAVEASP